MKNVVILNNRSLNFYNFKELKENYNLRISAVVFDAAYKTLSDEAKETLDDIYISPDVASIEQPFPPFPEEFLCSVIEKELFKFKDTWLVAAEELNVLIAASLREKYNLPGSPSSIIVNYKNKVRQKEVLAKVGIRIPKFAPVFREFKEEKLKIIYEDLVQNLNTPFILKPVDMGGTVGVGKIWTYREFCEQIHDLKYFSHLIAEEFIQDQLYHCDFIIQNNEYILAEASEYLYNGLSFVNGSNHGSLLLKKDDPLRAPIIDFCKNANSVLGLNSGCGHFEVFVTKEEEIIFLEAAARPAGSMVPLVFTKTFQRNYLNAALLSEIDELPGIFHESLEYYFWVIFPTKKGVIKELSSPSLQSPYDLQWCVNVGNVSNKPSSVSEKSGILVVRNQNYEILRSDFYSLRGFKAIEMQENLEERKSFL